MSIHSLPNVDPAAVAAPTGQAFYDSLPRVSDFDRMADPSRYVRLPDDWVVGVADIVGSTEEIQKGRYKAVNLVGAAVISAQLNAADKQPFPYVFGGDGAQFAVWPAQRAAAERAFHAVRHWALKEYGLRLRVAMTTVAEIRAAGHDVRVARFAPAEDVDYASFSGGGLTWFEARMKAGDAALEDAGQIDLPDLTGLSCRWANMDAERGAILSVILMPQAGVSDAAFATVAQEVIGATQGGRPVPAQGPEAVFPPPGLDLEARIDPKGWRWWRKLSILTSSALIWALFRSGRAFGRFDPAIYRSDVARNADYRKFDDGLKMTLDCDPQTQRRIEVILQSAYDQGLIYFGLHEQAAAMMTCVVPSPMERSHMHFVDGASGGYALAARNLRAQAA